MSTPPLRPGATSSGPTSDDDRTRNIRLPSLPDRPPAVVRPEWQAHVPPGMGTSPVAARPHAAAPAAETVRLEQPSPEALPRSPDAIARQPTDTLSSPWRVREQTLSFGAPADGGRAPAALGSRSPDFAAPAATRTRRWPWVVLILLPILVIAISGVLLFLLLGG